MSTIFAFYYPWWGAPPISSQYVHWNNGNPNRAWDHIGSTYFPGLDPYDSGDTAVLTKHMAQMKSAGVDVVMASWWGAGSFEDSKVVAILEAAAAAELQVSFMIEPYWTSQAQLADDIVYLHHQYGEHPAVLRLVRPTLYGPSNEPRMLIGIYSPPMVVGPVLDSMRGTVYDSIFLVRGDDSRLLSDVRIREALTGWLHADGMFNYGSYSYPAQLPASPDYIAMFCATPGFDDSRKAGVTTPTVLPRDGFAHYDAMWAPLAAQKVELAAVCSFNEWHEGTQIEPAKPHHIGWWFSRYDYQNYGPLARDAYLTRTAYWASLLKAAP